ncbi:protein of unknown function [Ralstonia solanacearum CFBP2957]|nr:protein of unknown function [Ralstonia solanacearum CFBP2957]
MQLRARVCVACPRTGRTKHGQQKERRLFAYSAFDIELLIGGPSLLAGAGMWFNGAHSDRKMERRWHFALPAIVCSISLAVLGLSDHSLTASVILFSLAVIGIQSAVPIFWSVPSG